ncbi:hypothetical protein L6259_02005 [Candidatus Parcubacteria bacterium]|nr:hypothetical protein [Candidatus Parcubacteria bacterium]
MAKDNKKCICKGAGGIFIPAGLFLGFGVGFLIENIPAGIFLGFGVGFFLYAVTVVFKK